VLLAIVTSPSGICTDTNDATATVSAVFPLMEPDVAVIVVLPIVLAVASPPAAIEATELVVELQVAVVVRSCVDPSVKVPVAVNCRRTPTGIVAFAGVTAIETKFGAVTVNAAVPVIPLCVAVIVAEPAALVAASPPAAIVATDVFKEVQAAVVVRSWVLLSL
jgi:hypothetical protein